MAAHRRIEAMHGDEMVMPSLMGARVLLVQNDPFVAADLDLMIDEAEGKVVAIATSREDALSLLDHEPVDIAIIDPNSAMAKLPRGRDPQQTRCSLRDLPTGKHLTSAILSVGVEPRYSARNRSEAHACPRADAVPALMRLSRGAGAGAYSSGSRRLLRSRSRSAFVCSQVQS